MQVPSALPSYLQLKMTEKLTELFGGGNFSGNSRNYALLKQISKKLGSDFLQNSVRKEAKESRCNFEESVQCYFKYQIIMHAVAKTSYSQNNQRDIPSFYLNSIPKYAPLCEPSLPLSSEHVESVLRKKKNFKADTAEKTALVENKIAEFCKTLSEYSRQSLARDWRKSFDETVRYISSQADHLNFESAQVRPQKLALNEMLHTYYTELTEGLNIMKRMLNLLEKKFDYQLNFAEMFHLDSQCLLLKIRIFELKVMSATYTDESLPALRKISNGLNTKREDLENERDKTMSALEAYQVLGSDYVTLVETYQQLMEQISQQKWAISALSRGERDLS